MGAYGTSPICSASKPTHAPHQSRASRACAAGKCRQGKMARLFHRVLAIRTRHLSRALVSAARSYPVLRHGFITARHQPHVPIKHRDVLVSLLYTFTNPSFTYFNIALWRQSNCSLIPPPAASSLAVPTLFMLLEQTPSLLLFRYCLIKFDYRGMYRDNIAFSTENDR